MTRVAVRPELLRWARERASVMAADESTGRFPKFPEWEAGDTRPTLKQLEDFARAVHVPVGYLFLPSPPEEPLPIPDCRTHDGRGVRRASPNLIAMLYSDLLVQIGHQVCGLARAENEAVAMAGRLLPDVIIADLGLHKGSGLRAMERIRQGRDVPHIFITGGDLAFRDAGEAAGLLRKPFSEDQLIAAIARVTAKAGLDPEH